MTARPATEPAVAPITVLVVDDHRMFSDSLVRVLRDEPDIDVIGTASDLATYRRLRAEREPDVVLLDYVLPDGEAPDELRSGPVGGTAKVIIMTALSDDSTLGAAVEAGCDGFITKDRAALDLVEAVRTVHAGGTAIGRDLLARAVAALRRNDSIQALSRREREVLQLLAEGRSNAEIASELFISLNTVRNHVQNLLVRLDVHSRHEAVAVGFRRGLVSSRSG